MCAKERKFQRIKITKARNLHPLSATDGKIFPLEVTKEKWRNGSIEMYFCRWMMFCDENILVGRATVGMAGGRSLVGLLVLEKEEECYDVKLILEIIILWSTAIFFIFSSSKASHLTKVHTTVFSAGVKKPRKKENFSCWQCITFEYKW